MINLLEHPRYRDRVIDTLTDAMRDVILGYAGHTATTALVEEIRGEIKAEIIRRFPVAANRLFDMDQPIDDAIAAYVCGSRISREERVK